MTDDVELLVTGPLLDGEVADIRAELQAFGWQTRVSRMPTRRGAEIAWTLLLTVPAEAIAKTMLERLGVHIYQELRGFVQRRLHRVTDPAARAVVLESADTGARYALDADLPLDAYHQMIEALTEGAPTGTDLHIFDRGRSQWVAAKV